MIRVDPRTVILIAGVMSSFMALILFFLKRSYPPSIKGLGEWSVALLLVAAGCALGSGLGVFPDVVSITLPRIFFPTGLFLAYVGTQRFFGVTPRLAPWVTLIAIGVVVQVWFTFVWPHYPTRLAVSNVMGACLFFAFANLVRQQSGKSFAKLLTLAVLVAMLVIVVMRLLTLLLWPVDKDAFDTSPQQLVYVTGFSFFIVLLSVSLVLMAAERLHTEVAYLASHDSLTNALTRRHFNEVCAIELVRSQRNGHHMALLVMDLDHFKAINDTRGHQRGDQVLVEFVIRVHALLRRPDQLGRFGGEEFVALLPETSLEEAQRVAERIRQASTLPINDIRCTVSIGVTTKQTQGDTVDSLIGRADAAMYQAKAKGRNRVECA